MESLFFCQVPAKPFAWGHQVFPFSRWEAHWTPDNDNKQQTVGIFLIASTRLYAVGKYYYDLVGSIPAHGRVVGSRRPLRSLPTWAIQWLMSSITFCSTQHSPTLTQENRKKMKDWLEKRWRKWGWVFRHRGYNSLRMACFAAWSKCLLYCEENPRVVMEMKIQSSPMPKFFQFVHILQAIPYWERWIIRERKQQNSGQTKNTYLSIKYSPYESKQ